MRHKGKVLLNTWVGLVLRGEEVRELKQNRWNRREAFLEIGKCVWLRNLVLKNDRVPLLLTARERIKIRHLTNRPCDYSVEEITRVKGRFKAHLLVTERRRDRVGRKYDRNKLEEELESRIVL